MAHEELKYAQHLVIRHVLEKGFRKALYWPLTF